MKWLAMLLLGGITAQAQNFRVSSDLVLVNATVIDPAGLPVTGLTQDRFRLFERRAEERIAYFVEEETPVSVVIVADTSASMKKKLDVCAQAAAELFRSILPGDEFALVTFAERPQLAVPWTADDQAIRAALSQTQAHGTTALRDALLFGAQYARHARNARKVLLVVSDGGDNHSRYSSMELRRRLEEADLDVYAINMTESWYTGPKDEVSEESSPLEELCEHISGRYVKVDNMRKLPEAVSRISREIRSQYVLGYHPGQLSGAGRFRRVEVKVAPPSGVRRVSVYWRQGWREPE
jgi:Ca-activated chloride channel homolog